MRESKPLVSIVVLNWNGTEDTIACVESIAKLAYKNIELIIVDNGSRTPITIDDLPTRPTHTTIIHNERNQGFTGGELTGYTHAKGKFIVILNNDAIIDPGAVEECLRTFEQDKKIAAVGGRSYQLDDDGNKFGIQHYTHQRIDPITAEVTTYMKDDGVARDVSNVSGACVMLRRDAIEACGYFDNSFFAYYEETDLFSRFRRAGWRIVFNPKVIIWHKLGASTRNKKYMYNYLMLKNQFLFAYKNFDIQYLRLFKKAYKRHVRRSLLIYLKKLGRMDKHDIIHKARVDAYLKILFTYPARAAARKKNINVNSSFNLNETLFVDNPLPVSLLVDATTLNASQIKRVLSNITAINKRPIRLNEIIIVSKVPVAIPASEALIRVENIVNKGLFDMSALDFFFMASNNELLLFGNSSLADHALSEDELSAYEGYIKKIYTQWASSESAAIVTGSHNRRLNLSRYISDQFDIIAIRKTMLTGHISEQTEITTISHDVLTDVVGRAIAQGLPVVEQEEGTAFFGIPKGTINYSYEPLLKSPFRWRIKQTLTDLHLWSISSKVLRKAIGFSKLGRKRSTLTEHDLSTIEYKKDIPVIINTRDRYEPLVKLLAWLKQIGHERIMFIDNDSTYPPLVDLFNSTDYQVVRLGRNGMHKAPWESMGVRFGAKDSAYIVTDPDIIPVDKCPDDAIKHFANLLNKYPDIDKVGFGLLINDLPDHFNQKEHVLAWESRYWTKDLLLEKDAYKTSLDTTFALYRPHTEWFLDPSIRTGGKYSAHHEPWYQNSADPTEDFLFYKMRASREVSTWGMDQLPKHHMRALRKEGFIDELIEED